MSACTSSLPFNVKLDDETATLGMTANGQKAVWAHQLPTLDGLMNDKLKLTKA